MGGNVDDTTPLTESGMDSLSAVEFRNRLVPATVVSFETLPPKWLISALCFETSPQFVFSSFFAVERVQKYIGFIRHMICLHLFSYIFIEFEFHID